MNHLELSPSAGSTRSVKRKGRGMGSGNGKTAGRGHKGQWARSGGGVRIGFEGGQMPLYRRTPKRGFNNARFATTYAEVNLSSLNVFKKGTVVTVDKLLEQRIINKVLDGVKILGRGELKSAITVKANAFSASAKQKIEAAGGKTEVV